jgi:Protein of unknown function (DUF1552)
MSQTSKRFELSRRACLRGAGVALALPMLEAMMPRVARAQKAGAPKPLRLIVWTLPDGVRMDAWTPKTTGAGYATMPIALPLDPWKAQFNVISGLANTPASVVSGDIFAGSHARATGAMLSQMPLTFTSGNNIKNGISMDQVIANYLKTTVPSLRLPSLELGAVYAGATGNCEDGFSCAYLTNLAWTGPTTFLPKETNPKAVFDRLMKGGLPGPGPVSTTTPPASTPTTPTAPTPAAKALAYQKGILDLVAQDTTALKARLGRADQAKLSDYLDSVNELERRVNAMTPAPVSGAGGAGGSGGTAPPPTPTAGCQATAAPKDGTYLGTDRTKNIYGYAEVLTAMNDMIALALTCDLTRVVTFMSEIPLNTQTNFAFVGVDSANYHDDISHHGGNPTKLAGIQTVNTFYAQQFAYLLGKLASTTDVDGTSSVLDNSIVIFTSEFGDGDDHYHWNLPMLVAGKAGGAFKTGRHILYPSTPDNGAGARETARRGDMPLANLYLSIMQAFGLNVSTFGSVDGTTPYGTKPLVELAG